MFGWLRNLLVKPSPLELWRVGFSDDDIVTNDGQGTERRIALRDLRRVVVATDDSGPWDADVVFVLYSDGADPVAAFPLEAIGGQDFVAWMSAQPGYQERELCDAMASTRVARFEVLTIEPNAA